MFRDRIAVDPGHLKQEERHSAPRPQPYPDRCRGHMLRSRLAEVFPTLHAEYPRVWLVMTLHFSSPESCAPVTRHGARYPSPVTFAGHRSRIRSSSDVGIDHRSYTAPSQFSVPLRVLVHKFLSRPINSFVERHILTLCHGSVISLVSNTVSK